jgi:hypothetical protein
MTLMLKGRSSLFIFFNSTAVYKNKNQYDKKIIIIFRLKFNYSRGKYKVWYTARHSFFFFIIW